LTSPFDAFAVYEQEIGAPVGLIRTINSANPDDNAWAKFERSQVDSAGFSELFEQEAKQAGYTMSGQRVLECLTGEVRPLMVEAIRRVSVAGYKTACLTNNFAPRQDKADSTEQSNDATKRGQEIASVMAMFDHVVQSSVIGVRKPEPAFYEHALEIVGVNAVNAVFLDDLGINLKPAKAMGMETIKVVAAQDALRELEALLDLDLLSDART